MVNPKDQSMNDRPRRTTDHGPLTPRTRGFSFAEVMFAVVILGIGFILVAAIFPVAITQSQQTADDTTAAAIARDTGAAIASMTKTVPNPMYDPTSTSPPPDTRKIQTFPLLPPTVKNYTRGNQYSTTGSYGGRIAVPPPAVVVPFTGPRWDAVRGNALLPHDPRYAFVAFYKRENNAASASLYVLAVNARSQQTFTPVGDLAPSSSSSNSQFSIVTKRTLPPVSAAPAIPPKTTIHSDIASLPGAPPYGSTVLRVSALVSGSPGQPYGRSYRLGRQPTPTKFDYEMEPGDGLFFAAAQAGTWGTNDGFFDTQSGSLPVICDRSWGLEPTVAYAQFRADPTNPAGRVFLTVLPISASSPSQPPPAAAAPGAFVIIADDFPCDTDNINNQSSRITDNFGDGYEIPPNVFPSSAAPLAHWSVGALNGRIFRIGSSAAHDADLIDPAQPGQTIPQAFNLDPQYGMRPPSTSPLMPKYSPDSVPNPDLANAEGKASSYGSFGQVKVYIVGAPSPTANDKDPLARDVGLFQAIIPAR